MSWETLEGSVIKFRARFASKCAACGGRIAVDTPVQGIRRLETVVKGDGKYKWVVWHDAVECHRKILENPDFQSPGKIVDESKDDDDFLTVYKQERASL